MEKDNPCKDCDFCCRHIALEIDTPETSEEFDQIKWFLTHKDIWIFIDHDDSWNLQANNKCEKLIQGKCSIYEKRPQICRSYDTENCEKYGQGESSKILWKTIEEFEDWIEKGKVIPEE